MNNMEYVEQVIDSMMDDFKQTKENEDADILDKSFCDCAIGTLRMLKLRLGLIG